MGFLLSPKFSLNCCCGPCCVIARFEVRRCEDDGLAEGATVTVKDSDDATVATGTTDDTGTVALLLPEVSGAEYTATFSHPDEEDVAVPFKSHCGVNTVSGYLGNAPLDGVEREEEFCVLVVSGVTGEPLQDAAVYFFGGGGGEAVDLRWTGADGIANLNAVGGVQGCPVYANDPTAYGPGFVALGNWQADNDSPFHEGVARFVGRCRLAGPFILRLYPDAIP